MKLSVTYEIFDFGKTYIKLKKELPLSLAPIAAMPLPLSGKSE
jgi:hypothetical protein